MRNKNTLRRVNRLSITTQYHYEGDDDGHRLIITAAFAAADWLILCAPWSRAARRPVCTAAPSRGAERPGWEYAARARSAAAV